MSSVPLGNGPHVTTSPQLSPLTTKSQFGESYDAEASTNFRVTPERGNALGEGEDVQGKQPEQRKPDVAGGESGDDSCLDHGVEGTEVLNESLGDPGKTDASDESTLHRVREVREQQGISLRSMSRRLGVDIKTCRKLEDPARDLTLSELQSIQAALEVPLQDLLVDRNCLSRPVEERAKMIRIMKTAVALRELKTSQRAERMTQMLCEQLVEVMPELAEVSGWPQFGARRGKSALGRVLSQQVDMSQLYSE